MGKAGSVSEFLQTQIKSGQLREDAVQLRAAGALDNLSQRLDGYAPKRSLFGKFDEAPKGLYLWGGVGRGKSMLMDVFFDHLTSKKKSRVHFHEFMQDVHRRIGEWRKLDDKQKRSKPYYVRGVGDDPIAPTAKAIAYKAHILCFDEFHVTDIADAMILSRLFTALIERGVVVVATSNRKPDALYKDGLNRQLFLPFIDLLKQKLEIFDFDGDVDHRLRKLQRAPVYITPLDESADEGIEAIWNRLTRPVRPKETVLTIQGRELNILAAGGTARASCDALCGAALGAADYLALANHFSALVLENVPQLDAENRNEAKRFVTLIDALYETRTKLVISAAVSPDQLYKDGDGAFEFERTASRLIEMQSAEYLGAGHSLSNPPT
ncbi:MAG: cell division protein ZapE [Acidimicrobiales bacterium]|nr:MAG: cell division protein ZapE [Acidimicrobiales bacterium]